MRDSGGAADAIADYVLHGRTDDPKFQEPKLRRLLARIAVLQTRSEQRVLTFFKMDDNVEMSTMLLRALVKVLLAPPPPDARDDSSGGSPGALERHASSEVVLAEKKTRALVLAVNWDRVDIARDLLTQMSTQRLFTYGHQLALQFMLERRRAELFKVSGLPRPTATYRDLPRPPTTSIDLP